MRPIAIGMYTMLYMYIHILYTLKSFRITRVEASMGLADTYCWQQTYAPWCIHHHPLVKRLHITPVTKRFLMCERKWSNSSIKILEIPLFSKMCAVKWCDWNLEFAPKTWDVMETQWSCYLGHIVSYYLYMSKKWVGISLIKQSSGFRSPVSLPRPTRWCFQSKCISQRTGQGMRISLTNHPPSKQGRDELELE